MIRAVAAVVVGFVVIAAIVNIPLALYALEPAAAFENGTTDVVTTGWMILSVVVSVAAALCGGFVAGVIAKDPANKPVAVLAGIVFVLGALSALGSFGETPGQPTWYAFALPFIGGSGVLIGGSLRQLWRRPNN